MLETGGQLRLEQEPSPEALVLGELAREDLDRDLAVKVHVLGQVDGAHRAASE